MVHFHMNLISKKWPAKPELLFLWKLIGIITV